MDSGSDRAALARVWDVRCWPRFQPGGARNARLATWAVAAAAAVVTVIGVLAGVQFHSGATGFGTRRAPDASAGGR